MLFNGILENNGKPGGWAPPDSRVVEFASIADRIGDFGGDGSIFFGKRQGGDS